MYKRLTSDPFMNYLHEALFELISKLLVRRRKRSAKCTVHSLSNRVRVTLKKQNNSINFVIFSFRVKPDVDCGYKLDQRQWCSGLRYVTYHIEVLTLTEVIP